MTVRAASLLRTGAVLGAATGVLVLTTLPASAHVSADASTTAAGGYSVVTVAVPHGCDGSATTKIEIKIPEQIESVTPTVNPGWTVRTRTEKLDAPVTDDGETITTRVAEVVYTAKTPLPDGYRDTFQLSVHLPDTPQTLSFPTIQTCERGSVAWIEEPAPGQSEDDVEHPAPAVTVTDEAAEDHHGSGAADDATTDDHATAAVETAASGGSGTAAGWAGLGLGAVGAALGATALVRTRRSGS